MSQLEPSNVLLVEDNPADARLVAVRLAASQAEVRLRHVANLADAQQALGREDERLDAVLLDLWLPDSRGLATLRRIRRAREDLPVVVLTGCHDPGVRDEVLRHGADAYFTKSDVDAPGLADALHRVTAHEQVPWGPRGTICGGRLARVDLRDVLDAIECPALVLDRLDSVAYFNGAANVLLGRGETLDGHLLDRSDAKLEGSDLRFLDIWWETEPSTLLLLGDHADSHARALDTSRSHEPARPADELTHRAVDALERERGARIRIARRLRAPAAHVEASDTLPDLVRALGRAAWGQASVPSMDPGAAPPIGPHEAALRVVSRVAGDAYVLRMEYRPGGHDVAVPGESGGARGVDPAALVESLCRCIGAPVRLGRWPGYGTSLQAEIPLRATDDSKHA